jgi:NADH dehydrogenase
MTSKKRLIVVGGGFAGIEVVRNVPLGMFDVLLINDENYHFFQPLLYQVATGVLSASQISSPLRTIFRHRRDVSVLKGRVTGLDVGSRSVLVGESSYPYDYLVLATGSRQSYFGQEQWKPLAPGLKSVSDALNMRSRIYGAFEAAEFEEDPVRREALLTFVIVGAGPTGVELAGALAEVAQKVLVEEFRRIDTRAVKIVMLELSNRILVPFDEELAQVGLKMLGELGVEVLLNHRLTDIGSDYVMCLDPSGQSLKIPTHTVLWSAGVQASQLGKILRDRVGCELDRMGRVVVDPNLRVPEAPEIFIAGDLACVKTPDGKTLPGIAPVAVSQGSYVGRALSNIERSLALADYIYQEQPSFAVVGRNRALVQYGWLRHAGICAWVVWALVHVAFLVEFRNRMQVLVSWLWNYLTFQLNARLIFKQFEQESSDE